MCNNPSKTEQAYSMINDAGGMFVQSIKFVESHHGNTKDIAIYGQEYTGTTYRMTQKIRQVSRI